MTRSKRDSGQALLLVALLLVVLLLSAGVAIDMGYLRYQRRLIQTAADSAAVAAAAKIGYCGGNSGCQALFDEGQNSAAYNGFADNRPNTQVAINYPPLSGPHASDSNYAEAVIIRQVPTFFVKILGSSFKSFSVSGRAVATPGPGPSCVYALTGLGLDGFNTQVYAPNCVVSDAGNLSVPASSYILDTEGTVYGLTYTSVGNVQPTPVQGAPVGNPLSYLSNAPPSVGAAASSCGYTYCQGSYPSGIQITGSSAVTFQPGVYVLGGNGLSIEAYGSVTGSDVTFYMSGNSAAVLINPGASYSRCSDPPPVYLGSKVQLIAPTDPNDPNAGILFVQSGNQNSIITLNNGDDCDGGKPSGTPESYLWGVLYFPTATLTLVGTGADSDNGCSPIPRFTVIVAGTLTPEGNINVGVGDCGGISNFSFPTVMPNPIKDAVLVE